METFSNTLNYEQAPGSPCFLLTVSNRLLLVLLGFFFFSTNFVYWSNSCFVAAKKNVPNCKDFICFKRAHIRGKRHEQDLISWTLSHCRSSESLLCFCRGVLRHPGTKSSTLITRLWKEERRSGENSYFWHNAATEKRPHARVSSQNWAWVFPVSMCMYGGQYSMWVSMGQREIGREREADKRKGDGEKGSIKVDVWLRGVASLCVSSLCNSASNVNRSVIRNSKHLPSWGRPLSFSLVLQTAHIMHCIKYLLVFVRLGLHFLHKNNQNKNRGASISLLAFVCSRQKW